MSENERLLQSKINRMRGKIKFKEKRINELQKALDIAMEAIEFYGDGSNWGEVMEYPHTWGAISNCDEIDLEDGKVGGKKARQAKQKIKEVLGEKDN